MSTTIVNIAISGTTSSVASTGVEVESLVGLSTDSAFSTSDISFSVCQTLDGTYLPLKLDTGAAYKIVAGVASSYYSLDHLKFLGARYIKVVAPGVTIASPTNITATPSGTGGTIAAGTYYYKVTAVDSYGQTMPSAEVSAVTTGVTSSVSVAWTAVTGAASYRIYKGITSNGQDAYFTSTAANYTDTGSAGTAGTVPTTAAQQAATVITLVSKLIK